MALKPIEILINAKDNASSVFDALNGKLKVIGVAIAGYFGIQAFAGVVKGAADFEQGMSRVQAATGASAKEMQSLRDAATAAGASTKFTSTEAASALETLAKAGLSAKDAIAALPAVLNLAQAGDIELGTASEFVTKAVMGMGLAFTDAGRVADVLALGANATNTSVTGLAQALSYAAPVANSLGVSLESTVAIIGKFADAGIDASRAGTALNSIMSQFANPASKFREELGAAGITTNNFEAALHQLAAAGPRGAKAINAVGQEAGPALRALLNQGLGALDDLVVKLKTAEGSAAATAKVMQDNLNGSFTGLASAWDTVKNALGTPVLPILKDGVDQLATAFRSAVSDGTIGKFGDAIATALQSGIKWMREFVGTVNFTQVAADLRAFADRTGEVFTQIGQYATSAGDIVKLAYGVMSAGSNAVLTAIYGIGSGFATVASTIMEGVAKLRDGLSKVTFGGLSDSFKLAAEDARNAAQGFGDAAQAMRDKASQALQDTAKSAELARDGFTGLAGAITSAKPAVTAAAQAFDDMGKRLEETRQKSQALQKATDDKKASDTAATVAVRQLKDEYGALVASGNLQAAAEKLQEINKVLQATPAAGKDAVKAAQEAAQLIADAFQRMGITSSEELKRQAEGAKRDYEIIKNAGTSTAEDIGKAFQKAAEAAIAANKGVAPAWVEAQAAAKGFTLEVDASGKTIVKAMNDGKQAVAALGEQWKLTAEQIKANEEALDRLNMKYTLSSNYTERQLTLLEKENALLERREALEDKRLNRDKEGFSLDTGGKRVNVAVETKTSIFDRAKSQGLTDAQALKLSQETALPFQGQSAHVTTASDRAGENWGTRLQAQIDQIKLGNAANGGAGNAAGGGQTGNSFVTNVTIDGATLPINTTDSQSSSNVQELVRQLAAARRTASR